MMSDDDVAVIAIGINDGRDQRQWRIQKFTLEAEALTSLSPSFSPLTFPSLSGAVLSETFWDSGPVVRNYQ